MSILKLKPYHYYFTSCVIIGSFVGFNEGRDLADDICFKKKELTLFEKVFEYGAYGTIITTITSLYIMGSPIYVPYKLYKIYN